MSVLDNWNQWKEFLGSRLDQAENDGMNREVIGDMAYQIGDYLAKNVDPKNEQERVLADLWSVATPDDQHAIANMMVRLVQKNG
ncbi:DUF3243 domain-containing protein [Mesobacillus zeae]|uniref:DUF3243 domain-containing protein n=1 Tax=Mesobacillus zeae TaxID=1917180 RepID=A0A398BEN9_9BACI|nr:DUF3243 domain-containing protein [Mesobacillus zeae]RID88064.1 DUF3243 domain-containing protein [Mesobacillus zeae]